MPSKLKSSVNSDFQPGPTTEPTSLDVTESSSSGTDYNITLATKIDNTLPAGTYHNTFVLTTTTNDPPYDDIMQNWSGCDELPEETKTLTLLDTRDNKTYTVAKLKDGLCWMTQNLEIENYNLTSADSDVSSDFQIPASTDKPNSSNSYESKELHVDSTYGGYYTWYTATAGEGTQSVSTNGQNVSHSICPKGWRLPTKDEFVALDKALGGTGQNSQNNSSLVSKYQASPNNFKMGGTYYSGLANVVGTYAYYWSSTALNSTYAYYLDFGSSRVNPQNGHTKDHLRSVRCVARPDNPKKVDTMQTVDEWGDSIKEGKTALSKDSRDDKEYTVARLADGKLWMTQNLEIENYNLTSTDSDVTSDYSLPYSSTSGFNSNTAANVYVDSQYGGYYTWLAATAGTGNSATSNGAQASGSVCPKGWRLPTKQDFIDLDKALGGTGQNSQTSSNLVSKYQASPNNFKMGGYYRSSSPGTVGTSAYYWSATAVSSTNAYALYFGPSGNVFPQTGDVKSDGHSVRCVSRTDDPIDVGTMQTVNEWGDSVKEGKTAISKDSRDNKEYTVARLADGKLWMTKNLEIANKTLTSDDSDVASSFTLPASSTSGFNAYDKSFVYVDSTYGGYYSWFAATAGEGTLSKSSGDVSHSICPKGWRLPTQTEYSNLVTKLGGTSSTGATALQASPNNFKKGYYYGDSSFDVGAGYYWSASAYPSYNGDAYYLYFYDSIDPARSNYKFYGQSVRCVARE